jgi:hypothetical protein
MIIIVVVVIHVVASGSGCCDGRYGWRRRYQLLLLLRPGRLLRLRGCFPLRIPLLLLFLIPSLLVDFFLEFIVVVVVVVVVVAVGVKSHRAERGLVVTPSAPFARAGSSLVAVTIGKEVLHVKDKPLPHLHCDRCLLNRFLRWLCVLAVQILYL